MHRTFLAWERWTRTGRDALVDSPMHWLRAAEVPDRDLDTLFPERARWDPQMGAFILPPNAPSISWPLVGGDASRVGVTGAAECFWTALPERDRPAMSHALVGRLWAMLQVDVWGDGTGARTRGVLYLYRHDGATWREWGAPPLVIERPGDVDWQNRFPALARALARDAVADAPPDVEAAFGDSFTAGASTAYTSTTPRRPSSTANEARVETGAPGRDT